MARFIIVDQMHLHSSTYEALNEIISHCRVPIQPLAQDGLHQSPPIHKHRWILSRYIYTTTVDLQNNFQHQLLDPSQRRSESSKSRNRSGSVLATPWRTRRCSTSLKSILTYYKARASLTYGMIIAFNQAKTPYEKSKNTSHTLTSSCCS